MKKFIAYFDYLGFKEFIENNDLEKQKKIMHNNFRDMESALGQGKFKDAPNGYVADISNSKINCINFSDTVVFFSNDDTIESLRDILDVADKFNWETNLFHFPVRGSLVFGEIEYVDFKQKNSVGGVYNINSVFGKGLVTAHLKAEAQNWAGTVLDQSFVDQIGVNGFDPVDFLRPYAKYYKVPYKNEIDMPAEYVLNLVQGTLNDEALKNFRRNIIENFAAHKKGVDNEKVQAKLSNTLQFLESFYLKDE